MFGFIGMLCPHVPAEAALVNVRFAANLAFKVRAVFAFVPPQVVRIVKDVIAMAVCAREESL